MSTPGIGCVLFNSLQQWCTRLLPPSPPKTSTQELNLARWLRKQCPRNLAADTLKFLGCYHRAIRAEGHIEVLRLPPDIRLLWKSFLDTTVAPEICKIEAFATQNHVALLQAFLIALWLGMVATPTPTQGVTIPRPSEIDQNPSLRMRKRTQIQT